MSDEYEDRTIRFSLLWLNGKPRHNHIDQECCIDFSCCHPDLFTTDRKEREKIHANLIKRLREKREEREKDKQND